MGWLYPDLAEFDKAKRDMVDLILSNRELHNEKERLEMLLDDARGDREHLWRIAENALEGERTAYKSSINIVRGMDGMGQPYPEAPMIPQTAIPPEDVEPFGRPMETATEKMNRKNRELTARVVERQKIRREKRLTQ